MGLTLPGHFTAALGYVGCGWQTPQAGAGQARGREGKGAWGGPGRGPAAPGHWPRVQDCEPTQTHQLSSLRLPLREGPPRGGHAEAEGPVWIQSPNLQVWAPHYSPTHSQDPLRRELGAQPDRDKDGGAAWENRAPFPLSRACEEPSSPTASPALETQPPARPPASPPRSPGPAPAISKPRTQKCMKLRSGSGTPCVLFGVADENIPGSSGKRTAVFTSRGPGVNHTGVTLSLRFTEKHPYLRLPPRQTERKAKPWPAFREVPFCSTRAPGHRRVLTQPRRPTRSEMNVVTPYWISIGGAGPRRPLNRERKTRFSSTVCTSSFKVTLNISNTMAGISQIPLIQQLGIQSASLETKHEKSSPLQDTRYVYTNNRSLCKNEQTNQKKKKKEKRFSSVQSFSLSESLRPHELQHARPPCPID